jgi:hypothetical protein
LLPITSAFDDKHIKQNFIAGIHPQLNEEPKDFTIILDDNGNEVTWYFETGLLNSLNAWLSIGTFVNNE